jgi:hypothetical protein
MLCSYCQQVELTLEEAKSAKKGCMFCAIDTSITMARATGLKVAMPKPIEYGRTQQEYDDYMRRISKKASHTDLKQKMQDAADTLEPPGQDTDTDTKQKQYVQRPGQPYDFSNDHIGQLLKDFDPNDPPHEYEEMLSDDFFIKASVPGPLNDKMDAMIAKEIKRLFTTIVYLKTQGSAWERYFRDPEEPTGPQGVFPPT